MASSYYSSAPVMMAAPAAAGPSKANDKVCCSHAVSRSTELLSCARTALKISKSEYQNNPQNQPPPWWLSLDPSQLRLHSLQTSESDLSTLLEDGLSLLRTMEQNLSQLTSLVRRRGHTNDPTNEISMCIKHLQGDAKELAGIVQSVSGGNKPKSKQHGRHLELVANWLQTVAAQQTDRLKEILKVRGNVLAEQAQRRKLLNPRANGSSNSGGSTALRARQGTSVAAAASNSTPWDSPLFTMTAAPPAARSAPPSAVKRTTTAAPRSSTAAAPPLYGGSVGNGGYGGGYGGGGGGYGGASTGMRQRKAATTTTTNNNNDDNDVSQVQAQIQMRAQDRQSQARLETARHAERSLADLGQLFGKMSSLIHSQGETLEKIEDDVEVALGDVTAGHEEINKLYSLKKGNRALILKVFGIVIFFIIFMRLY